MSAKQPFIGFPPEAFTFLTGLEAHNERDWFQPRKDVYEAAIVTPALALIEALGDELRRFSPSVIAEPRIGGSLFRIHRDVRFSNDKRPYKTHVGIRLRDQAASGSSVRNGPLYYVELGPRHLRLGAGIKEFDPATLTAYRRRIVGNVRVRELRQAMTAAEKTGATLIGPQLAKPPAGTASSPHADLLRRKGLFALCEESLPAEIKSARFVSYCARRLRPLALLFAELRQVVSVSA